MSFHTIRFFLLRVENVRKVKKIINYNYFFNYNLCYFRGNCQNLNLIDIAHFTFLHFFFSKKLTKVERRCAICSDTFQFC